MASLHSPAPLRIGAVVVCGGFLAWMSAGCHPPPSPAAGTAAPPSPVVHTAVHTVEVTRIVEIPVTASPSFTPDTSPTPTGTPTTTGTATAASTPTPTPTYSPPRIRVRMWSQCRYGPGVGYLYEYDLFEGNLMEVIGWREILAQKQSGIWEPSVWLYVRAVGGVNICWVNSSLVEVVRGDVFDAPPYTSLLPASELYRPVRVVEAWRDGNNVTVMWQSIWMTEDDYRGYLVEAWVCHAGQLYFAPVGYTGVNVANPAVVIPDEPGCSQLSGARLYAAEKHGYTSWIQVPWPVWDPSPQAV
ncbi:MAG: hypothetical protein JW929_00140 [Anaerolineales bacterium]|nr:hypothetical protein [Anaerolineales bacterium]